MAMKIKFLFVIIFGFVLFGYSQNTDDSLSFHVGEINDSIKTSVDSEEILLSPYHNIALYSSKANVFL